MLQRLSKEQLTPIWSVEEMLLDQIVDIPAHAKTAHNGLLQKRLREDFYRIVCYVPKTTTSVKELN